MTALAQPRRTARRIGRIAVGLDFGERLLLGCLYALLVWKLAPSLAHAPFNALLIGGETIVIAFVVCRRQTSLITRNPLDWIFALAGTLPPLLFRAGGPQSAPQALAGALMIIGIIVQVWAKLSLRRSFGIAAANRGVKVGGPYSLVRHPMYLGYAITWIGFLSTNGSWRNLALALFAGVMQILRIIIEERLLEEDSAYAGYMARVRWRIIPGLF